MRRIGGRKKQIGVCVEYSNISILNRGVNKTILAMHFQTQC